LKLLALGKARWGKGGGEDELFEPPNIAGDTIC